MIYAVRYFSFKQHPEALLMLYAAEREGIAGSQVNLCSGVLLRSEWAGLAPWQL